MRERTQMKDELFEVEESIKTKTVKAKRHCEYIREWLNPLLAEIEEMRIADAAGLMDELVLLQAELLRLSNKAEELKAALYG